MVKHNSPAHHCAGLSQESGVSVTLRQTPGVSAYHVVAGGLRRASMNERTLSAT